MCDCKELAEKLRLDHIVLCCPECYEEVPKQFEHPQKDQVLPVDSPTLGYVVYLPVNDEDGEIDYMYVEYDIRTIEEAEQPEHALIDGWAFKPFNIVPAT